VTLLVLRPVHTSLPKSAMASSDPDDALDDARASSQGQMIQLIQPQQSTDAAPQIGMHSVVGSNSAEAAAQQAALHSIVLAHTESSWDIMFQGLLEYQKKYDSLAVPPDFYWRGRNLHEWCRNQRQLHESGRPDALLSTRRDRLMSIGFDFTPADSAPNHRNDALDETRWTVMYQGLSDYGRQNQSFSVPQGYLCDGRSLFDWMRHQRKLYSMTLEGKQPSLSAGRIERLKSIGFELDPTGRRQDRRSEEDRWEIMFQGLLQFYQANETFVLPEGYLHDNRNLFTWVHNQRRLYRNQIQGKTPTLASVRVHRLESIGFSFTPRMTKTERRRQRSQGMIRPADRSHDGSASSVADGAIGRPRHTSSTTAAHNVTLSDGVDRSSVSAAAEMLVSQALVKYQQLTANERELLLHRR
jgi:hypothetical protein